jgi:hypothetical protein
MRPAAALLLLFAASAAAQAPPAAPTPPPDPEGIPQHDLNRPQPRIVTPAGGVPAANPGKPPSDAVVLFDGKDLSQWASQKDGSPAAWKVENGYIEVVKGKGGIQTRQGFGDVQLHIEWMTPSPAKGQSQDRGNSGVFFAGDRYEIQVLDSYENKTYPDGQAGATYGQYPPLVNASRPPGEWQAYDIVFTAPRIDAAGAVEKPAIVTVFHNGLVVHHATAFAGPTAHKVIGKYTAAHARGPVRLQDHGNPVHFRNIWIRPLTAYDDVK